MFISKKLFCTGIIFISVFFAGINFLYARYEIKDDGVYWVNMKMMGADPKTFRQLVIPYSRDKDHVFFYERIVEGADPESFKFINGDFMTDKNYVYCGGKKLEMADKDSLVILTGEYSKDKNHVYRYCTLLPGVIPESFIFLGQYLTKDSQHVYYMEKIIQDADSATFKVLGPTNHGIYSGDKNYIFIDGKKVEGVYPVKDKKIYNSLKGRILLKVEKLGEAFYVNPYFPIVHFLNRPENAFNVMRFEGFGITNNDINKIPISVDFLSGLDSDNDGLPDSFETAIGSSINLNDSDKDGYSDKGEILSGYLASSEKKYPYDLNYAKKHSGKIFLQVEGEGEAWYVNPTDNKRYYLGKPTDAFNIMRNLGLGISDSDLSNLIND